MITREDFIYLFSIIFNIMNVMLFVITSNALDSNQNINDVKRLTLYL